MATELKGAINDSENALKTKVPWISAVVWIGIMLVTLSLRFSLGQTTFGKYKVFLVFFYAVSSWAIVALSNLRVYLEFRGYIEKYHNDIWKELTYVPMIGSGHYNSYRVLKYIFSSATLNDAKLAAYKVALRLRVGLAVLVFLSILPIAFIVLV